MVANQEVIQSQKKNVAASKIAKYTFLIQG